VNIRLYKKALGTRDEKRAFFFEKTNYSKLVAEAEKRWVEYTPQPEECRTIGIDGSFNHKPYQGIAVFAIDTVAVDSLFLCKEYYDTYRELYAVITEEVISLRLKWPRFEISLWYIKTMGPLKYSTSNNAIGGNNSFIDDVRSLKFHLRKLG
jgi:hypothetical protein